MTDPNSASQQGQATTEDRAGEDDPADAVAQTRRSTLAQLGAVALGTIGGVSGATAADTADPWRLVALPDTQSYVAKGFLAGDIHTEPLNAQTDWIVDNADELNVKFVTHEGDLVWNGDNRDEWDRIDEAMSTLDGEVPYGACVGNHDYLETRNRKSGTDLYEEYFGPQRYQDRSWYGGSGPLNRNHYQFFSGGGYEFLHISLEWEAHGTPDDAETPVGWAQRIMDQHPETPTILTTHAYISDGERGRSKDLEDENGFGNTGQQLWEKLIKPNPQLFMVLNGHYHDGGGFFGIGTSPDDGEYHQISYNDAGLPVYEVLANYQDKDKGGNGWLRLLSFLPGGGAGDQDRIAVETYSPYLDENQGGDRSEFSFDLQFDERFDVDATDRSKGPQTPVGGTPQSIPGRIEAEQFDAGGPGVAYKDESERNSGDTYRGGDVDIEPTDDESSPYAVTEFEDDEWLEYTVNVDSADEYTVTARVTGESGWFDDDPAFSLALDGEELTDEVELEEAEEWSTTTIEGVSLPAGEHVLRVACESATIKLDWLEFER
jgi:hypothetical protein